MVRLYLSPTRDDGFCFGYAEKGFPNIHLTVFQKDGKIYSHIKDETATTKEGRYPWSQNITPDLFNDHVNKITRRWIKRMDGRTRCYVMKPSLVEKIRRISPAVQGEGELHIPMEFMFGEVILDFKNRRRWIHTTLKKLSDTKPYFGYIMLKGGTVKTVFPMKDGKYLTYGQRQHTRFMGEQTRLMGFDMYFNYITLKHGKLISDIERSKISSGIIERAMQD